MAFVERDQPLERDHCIHGNTCMCCDVYISCILHYLVFETPCNGPVTLYGAVYVVYGR